jgi:hypothetical protein
VREDRDRSDVDDGSCVGEKFCRRSVRDVDVGVVAVTIEVAD